MRVLSEIEKVRERIDAGVAFHEAMENRCVYCDEKVEDCGCDHRDYEDIFCGDCGLEWQDCGCTGTTEEELNE